MLDEQSRRQFHGRLLVAAAAILWSANGFFAKAPLLDTWPPAQRGILLAFYRAAFAGLTLLPFVRRPQFTRRLLPASLCFAAMNFTFLMAMSTTTEANAIWLQYTAPFWVFLIGVWWLGESSTRRDYVTLVCGMTGVGVILICEWFFFRGAARNGAGVAWGLLSGVTFASVVVSLRALRDLDSFWLISVCHLVAALVLAPLVIAQGLWPRPSVLAWLACFGTLQMAVPYLLFARGVRSVQVYEASYISLLEPLLVPLWVFLVWRNAPGYQPPAWWTWLGAAFILLGLLLRYSSFRPGQPTRPRGGKQTKGIAKEA